SPYPSQGKGQLLQVFILCGLTVFALLLWGTLLFWVFYPDIDFITSFYTTMVLLLGGYGDLFGAIEEVQTIPWGLRLFSLGLTLAGTAFVGVMYALLTERLLTLRFQFFKRRVPIPKRDHVIIVGLGRIGHHVGLLLQKFQQSAVIVTRNADPNLRSQLPIVEGELSQVMEEVNLSTAKSVVALTEAEMDNLEVALMSRAANPNIDLIIRTYHRRFRDTVARLFPYTQVLCASELSAEAFAAAAFGENVVSLFRLHFQTILVTDYRIEAEDTLNGLLLAEVAYGYGVVPIFYQRPQEARPLAMPSDDVRLQVGDRLVVLATIQALKQIEQGVMAPRNWQVRVEQARTADAAAAGAQVIARVTGCIPVIAQTLMDHLPGLVPVPLYQHQAMRLVRKLQQSQVRARAVEVATAL
ncbi:MAG: potassium channel family protein, partial [Prochlorothrix sp.]